MQSLMPFTLTHNPQFYGVGVFLPNWLASFKHQDNSHHRKHAMDHLFMTVVGGEGVLSRVFRFFCF